MNDGPGAGSDAPDDPVSDPVPDDEREALLTIAGGAVITAGGATLVAMRAIREVVPGLAAVVVGAAGGFGVYAGALRLLGVDPRDRLVARELAARYRAALAERLGR